jgi:prolipoprotein diacylglyceryltransferase
MMYAPARFTLDFLRVPPELGGDIRYFGLTPGQYMSILLFLVSLYFFNRVRKGEPIVWKKYEPKAVESDPKAKK